MANNINKASLIGCFFSCHNDEHHGTDATANGLTFDEDGNLVMMLRK